MQDAPFRLLNSSSPRPESIPPPYSAPAVAQSPSSANIVPTLDHENRNPKAHSPSSPSMPLPHLNRSPLSHLRRNIPRIGAITAAIAAILWSTQMIYFLVWFVSQSPQSDGSWSRIGFSYAAFPFISCVGARREGWFKTSSITVAILLWITFSIDYFLGRKSPVGRWWRLGKFVLSSISSVFLIALSFASVNDHHKLHLIFTSFQIICMGLAKVCDWELNNAMKEHTSSNPYLKRARAWKRVAASIALPCAILALIGIYFCDAKFENNQVVFTPKCWTLVSFAAPAEWTLSWCWVIFIATIGYDNLHIDYTIPLLLSTPPPTSRKVKWFEFWKRTHGRNEGSFEPKRGVNMHDADMQEDNERQRLRLADQTSDAESRRTRIIKIRNGGETPPSLVGTSVSRPVSMTNEGDMAEEDYETRMLRGDVELGWLPPNMPQSVLDNSGYYGRQISPQTDD